MAIATWVREELNEQHIPFEELHHPDAYTAQQVAQYEHVSGHCVAKVVCLMADGRPLEVILPASRKVQLDWVRDLLGANQLRLATEDELRTWFADCEVGAIPALRHWQGMEVLMDGHLQTNGNILILGGTHRDAVRMRFDDWFQMVQPRVELLSESAGPSAPPRN